MFSGFKCSILLFVFMSCVAENRKYFGNCVQVRNCGDNIYGIFPINLNVIYVKYVN